MLHSYLALIAEFADCLHEHNVKYHSLEGNLLIFKTQKNYLNSKLYVLRLQIQFLVIVLGHLYFLGLNFNPSYELKIICSNQENINLGSQKC